MRVSDPKEYEGSLRCGNTGRNGGPFLRLSSSEWVDIVLSIFFVLAAEAINTAVEAAVNLCTTEKHPWAKVAKDCAAGAVLLAAVNSVIVAVLVFGKRILS